MHIFSSFSLFFKSAENSSFYPNSKKENAKKDGEVFYLVL